VLVGDQHEIGSSYEEARFHDAGDLM
jgi:hypothetical protein